MELSRDTLEQLARQAFPEAIVVSYRPLEGGVLCWRYALQLQNPTTEVALRIYQPDVPSYTLEKEMYVLRVVMPETGVPTPRVVHFDDSQTTFDRPYAVLNLLPGEPLERALPRMDDLDQEAVGYELGRYLAKLHSIPLDKFGEFLGEDPMASVNEKAYTIARAMEWLDVCGEHDLMDEAVIAQLRCLMGQTRALDRESACFVHGDYQGRNITVEEGVAGFHVTAVFDFGRSQGWSPEWDMAGLLRDTFDAYPSLVKGFLDGYADTAGLPENLWRRLPVYRSVMGVCDVVYAHRTGDGSLLEGHRARLYHLLEEGGPEV